MCITRHFFIQKPALKETLVKLVNENYLTLQEYHSYKIYKPNKQNIYNYIQKFKNLAIVNDIIYITKDTYLTTAVFYNVILFVCLETFAMLLKYK